MNKTISPKIVSLTFGVMVISFLAAFYVVAWQEPSQAPPLGNVPSPINVGSTAQTKAGDLTIGIAAIKGSGAMSPNLNSDKVDDYHAADLLAQVRGGGDIGFPDGTVGTAKLIFPNINYTVPAGKTLYITTLYNPTAEYRNITIDGQVYYKLSPGAAMALASPLIVPGGSTANINSIWTTGYER